MLAATAHSNNMLERTYYEHDSLEGIEPADRVSAAGYPYITMAENIHMKQTGFMTEPNYWHLEQVFGDWMESPGHRANILNPDLHELGIGAAYGRYGLDLKTSGLYTVDFGTPR